MSGRFDPLGAMVRNAEQWVQRHRPIPTLESVMRKAEAQAHEADAHNDRDASKAIWAIQSAAEAMLKAQAEIRQATCSTGSNCTTVAVELNELLADVAGSYAKRRT